MHAWGMGWPTRSDPLGPGLALAVGFVVAGCGIARNFDVGAAQTPAANPLTEIEMTVPPTAVDWSSHTPAKILMADFTLTAPPTVFVVGQTYRLEIRNLIPLGRTFVAPGFFGAIEVRQFVIASGKSRLEPVGFAAEAMEALAFEATKIIAEMIPPGFETPVEEPPNPFALTPADPDLAAAGPLPDDPFALAGAAPGDALPENPLALAGEVPADALPENPFALAGEVPADALPDDAFALGGAVEEPPAEVVVLEPVDPADLAVNPFALGGDGPAPQEDVAPRPAPAADEPPLAVPDGDPAEFGEGLAAARVEAAEVALRDQALREQQQKEEELRLEAAREEAARQAMAENVNVPEEPAPAPAPQPEPAPEPAIEPAIEPDVEPVIDPVIGAVVEADLAPDLGPAPPPEPAPAPIIVLDDAAELALLTNWTAQAPRFAAPDGLELPANSSVFLTFMPLKSGTFEIGDGSRFAGLAATGTITVVAAVGGGERLSEAARPAANLAMFMAEVLEGPALSVAEPIPPELGDVDPLIQPPPTPNVELEAPAPAPVAPTPTPPPDPPAALDPAPTPNDPGLPDDI